MSKVYIATGDTYQHRELFTSWAWHWDAERRAWIEDNGSYVSDMGVQVIRDLPGVTVTVEEDGEPDWVIDESEL